MAAGAGETDLRDQEQDLMTYVLGRGVDRGVQGSCLIFAVGHQTVTPPDRNKGEKAKEKAKLRLDFSEFKRPQRQLGNAGQPAAGYGDLELKREGSGLERDLEDITLFQWK